MLKDGIYAIDRKSTFVTGAETALVDCGTGFSLIDLSLDHLMEFNGYVNRNYMYMYTNFQKFPRPGLMITKIKIEWQWYGKDGYYWQYYNPNPSYWGGTDGLPGPPCTWVGGVCPEKPMGCTIKPFLNIDGVYYYGDSVSIGTDRPDPPVCSWYSDPNYTNLKTASYTWEVDPSTGQAWANPDGRKIFYGVKGEAPDCNTAGTAKVMLIQATVYYINDSYEKSITYRRLDIDESSISLIQYSQTPNIRADDLRFMIRGGAIPERTELALVKDGLLIWRGMVWTLDEKTNGDVTILAKSQQVTLDYRLIGSEVFPFGGSATIEELLSADDPNPDPDTIRIYDPGGGDVWEFTPGTEASHYDNYHFYSFVKAKDSYNVGAFCFLNSWRGSFLTDFDHENPASPATTDTVRIGKLTDLDINSADTYIRPGTNDLGERTLNIAPDLHGVASSVLSEFHTKLGQEIRFRYDWDGYVYLDVAIEIARGSAASPLMKFRHGHRCRIVKSVPTTPNASALVGRGINPRVVSSWGRARTWVSSVFSNSRTGDCLKEWLEEKLDDDTTSYQVTVFKAIWTVRPGDYISVELPGEGIKSLRVRQITTFSYLTIITAGKHLTNLNEQFGTWRGVSGSIRETTALTRTSIGNSDECATSTSFTVSAANLAAGGWQCKVQLSWGFVVDNILYGASKVAGTWDIIHRINSNPAAAEAYVQISGESYSEYGAHEYEFEITQNMSAHGIEPYGANDVEVLAAGKYKWRKDGGDWSDEIEGYDVWHPTSDYNADLGNGLWGRVIFTTALSQPQITPVSTSILGLIGYAWACNTIDLSDAHKFLILKIDGKIVPPGRFVASGNTGSLDVDISEFCDAAATYTLTSELVNGLKKSASRQYYNTVSGSIEQFKHIVAVEA